MTEKLSKDQLNSIKKSYFNILALFLDQKTIESKYLRCLLKWGFQLHLSPDDLKKASINVTHLAFTQPAEKVEKLESIFHLVQMIYLDKVVEDIELEVASIYAEKLGFHASVVSELFQSIATAKYDEDNHPAVRQQVLDFLKLYNV
ncbi:MAG: hypothetical protein L0Y35_00825 [Flammeovirgaceae bacterium]|nr:hypothetical protein [Flammeovirgaceae bacterium]